MRIEGEKEGKGKGDGGGDGEEQAAVKVTGMPGKHVPQGVLGTLNDLVAAVPPTNGWMIELGSEGAAKSEGEGEGEFRCGYRSVFPSIPFHSLWRISIALVGPDTVL